MENDNMKYDLTWIVNNMDEKYIKENSSTVLELVQYMKSEMDRRKEIIQNMRRKELLRAVLNS